MPHALRARRLRHRPARAARRGRARRHGLPRPRHVLDAGRHARARVLLRLRRAARHADGPGAGPDRRRDRQHVGAAPAGPAAARLRRGALRRPHRQGDRAAARAAARSTTTFELVDAITAAIPAPARFAGGHPAKRTFQAIRIAVNDELAQLDAALPLAWDLLRRRRAPRRDHVPLARGPARQALPRRPHARLHLPAGPARCAAAAGRRRPSSCSGAPSRRRRARSPTTRARSPPGCGPPARSPTRRCAHDARTGTHAQPAHPRTLDRRPARPAPRLRTRARAAARAWSPRPPAAPRGLPRRGTTGLFDRVRALPDLRVVDRLLRSRLWIWALGVLLARHRDHAGLAAQAQLGHLARGGDDDDAGAPERRARAVDREAVRDRPDPDGRRGARACPARGRRRELPHAPARRTPKRAADRMQPPSEEARALLANGGVEPGSLVTAAPVTTDAGDRRPTPATTHDAGDGPGDGDDRRRPRRRRRHDRPDHPGRRPPRRPPPRRRPRPRPAAGRSRRRGRRGADRAPHRPPLRGLPGHAPARRRARRLARRRARELAQGRRRHPAEGRHRRPRPARHDHRRPRHRARGLPAGADDRRDAVPDQGPDQGGRASSRRVLRRARGRARSSSSRGATPASSTSPAACPMRRALRAQKLGIEGLEFIPEFSREYPRDWMASQLLGNVGTEGHGLSGLEYGLDKQLRGRDGERRLVRDALGDTIELREDAAHRAGRGRPPDARRQHPGPHRGGAGRGRRAVAAEGRDRARHGPARRRASSRSPTGRA